MPIKPSSTDLWAIDGIINLINAATNTNEKLITKIIPNMCEPNKRLSGSIIDFCKNEESIELLTSRINNRSIYGEVALSGSTAYISSNQKAKNELSIFADEIIDLVY